MVDLQAEVQLFDFDVFVGGVGFGWVAGAEDGGGDVEVDHGAGVGGVAGDGESAFVGYALAGFQKRLDEGRVFI